MWLTWTTSSALGNHGSTMMLGCPQPPVQHWATTGLPWCEVDLNHQFSIGQPRFYHDVWLPSTTSSALGHHGSTLMWGWPQPPVQHWATTVLPWCVVALNHQFSIGQPWVYHDMWLPSIKSLALGNHGSTMVHGCPQPPVHHWATTGLPWCVVAHNHQFTIGQPRVYHDVWLPSTTSSPLGNHGSTMMCGCP